MFFRRSGSSPRKAQAANRKPILARSADSRSASHGLQSGEARGNAFLLSPLRELKLPARRFAISDKIELPIRVRVRPFFPLERKLPLKTQDARHKTTGAEALPPRLHLPKPPSLQAPKPSWSCRRASSKEPVQNNQKQMATGFQHRLLPAHSRWRRLIRYSISARSNGMLVSSGT